MKLFDIIFFGLAVAWLVMIAVLELFFGAAGNRDLLLTSAHIAIALVPILTILILLFGLVQMRPPRAGMIAAVLVMLQLGVFAFSWSEPQGDVRDDLILVAVPILLQLFVVIRIFAVPNQPKVTKL